MIVWEAKLLMPNHTIVSCEIIIINDKLKSKRFSTSAQVRIHVVKMVGYKNVPSCCHHIAG